MPLVTLLLIQGPDQGQRYEFTQDEITIGRGAVNDIQLHDTESSRRHAFMRWTDTDGWRITDEGSSNGTFVNGTMIRKRILKDGDQIQIGRSILVCHFTRANRKAADRVQLMGPEHPADQSRIVSQSSGDGGRTFVEETAARLSSSTAAGANLQLLYRISEEAVRPSGSLDEILQRILDLTLGAVGADRGCMLVADSKTDRIEPRVVAFRAGTDASERIPLSTSIVEHVIRGGVAVRTTDARHDRRFEEAPSVLQSGIREAMCVPMQGRYELMGVIYVDTTTPSIDSMRFPGGSRFNEETMKLLTAIGRQSALAVESNRFQQALVQAERLAAVGQAIAMLSHHIKNILQGMKGGSHLIKMGLDDVNDDLILKGWSILERNQDRIYNLVMDMLAFGKERRPKLERANLNHTVQDVVDLIQPRADEEGVKIITHLAKDIPESLYDQEGIHRAALNIVINALDALRQTESPVIDITTRYDASRDQMAIQVSDNGPGIDPVEQAKLFNLFESSKGSAGTGIGLAASQKILREHGGEITIESQANAGARFTLKWPAHREEMDSPESPTLSG
ncbi:MAG: ATP-binding protein [Planctomycetaceae bacterium]